VGAGWSAQSASGLAALVAGALLLRLAAPLFPSVRGYYRIERERLLGSARRRELLDFIREHPGATTGRIARRFGLSYGTVRHHVDLLERFHVVTRRATASSVRLFESPSAADEPEAVALAER